MSNLLKYATDAQKFPMRTFTSENEIRLFDRTFTYTEMQAIATAIELIPAPGLNKIIVPMHHMYMGYKYNGVVYTLGGNVDILWGSGDKLYSMLTANFTHTSDTVIYYLNTMTNANPISASMNTPLLIQGGLNFASNGSPIRIYFKYQILDFS